MGHVKSRLYELLARVNYRKQHTNRFNPELAQQLALWDETKAEIGELLDWIKNQKVRAETCATTEK